MATGRSAVDAPRVPPRRSPDRPQVQDFRSCPKPDMGRRTAKAICRHRTQNLNNGRGRKSFPLRQRLGDFARRLDEQLRQRAERPIPQRDKDDRIAQIGQFHRERLDQGVVAGRCH